MQLELSEEQARLVADALRHYGAHLEVLGSDARESTVSARLHGEAYTAATLASKIGDLL